MSDFLDHPIRIFYRISDFSQLTINKKGKQIIKNRPSWFDKKRCLLNVIEHFPESEISILADNVTDETIAWLDKHCSHIPVERSQYGNGAGSFQHVLKQASDIVENRIIYFLEDDYLHLPNSEKVIKEGFKYGDYVTLFDHPDKYVNWQEGRDGVAGNPLITEDSEETRLYRTNSTHWKLTNSTVMTFASTTEIIKADMPGLEFYSKGKITKSYPFFRTVIEKRNRKLVSSIPGMSAHIETAYMSPFTDWEAVNNSVKLDT